MCPLTSRYRQHQAFQECLFVVAQFESYGKVDHCFSDWLKSKMKWVHVNGVPMRLSQTVVALCTMEAVYIQVKYVHPLKVPSLHISW